MKKIEFTRKQIEVLKDLCLNKKLIKVTGINGIGDEFETEGRITRNDLGETAVYPKGLYIEFGQSRENGSKQTDYYAPFQLNIDNGGIEPYAQFVIKSIVDEEGNLIYNNDNFKKIEKVAKRNLTKEIKKGYYTAHLIEDFDPVSDKLRSMVAKPINIDGTECVFTALRSITYNGSTSITVRKGPLVGSIPVSKDSYLATEHNDGTLEVIAVNKAEEVDRIFKERERIRYENDFNKEQE